METKSVSAVPFLLPEEKQGEIDELFKYLVEVHIDIQKNLITLRYNYINGQSESKLQYNELDLSYKYIAMSEFFELCSTCLKKLSTLKSRTFHLKIKDEAHYRISVQELKYIQEFTVKYMCFLSRSRNFSNESIPNDHIDYIEEKISTENASEMYIKLKRKYLNKMADSKRITGSSLASEIEILRESSVFRSVLNVQVLMQMLLFFLAEKIDVPAASSSSVDESANVQIIKMMHDSLAEFIDEMKGLRNEQKTYTEDVKAIKEMLKTVKKV